jgi:predicted lipoprotein with Yx(FWY)xxD motif
MTHSRPITFLAGAAAVALTALAVSACGSDGVTASTALPKTANGQPATIGVSASGLGRILVESQGRTLYLFRKDSGTKSTCFGECASDWPPLPAGGKPTVGSGANSSVVGTTTRSDGEQQVTYNGHPLYLYAGDEKAGDTSGHGVTTYGGGWYALTPAGDRVSSGASSSSSGGGY